MKAHLGFLPAAALAAAILSAPLALAAGKPPNAKQQMEYQHLASLSGKEFDQAFVKAQVKGHRKGIAEYQKEASASNSPASRYASASLPVLHKRLRIAESLQRSPSG